MTIRLDNSLTEDRADGVYLRLDNVNSPTATYTWTTALTTTNTITGGTLTDGTFSVTGGAITGATNTNWDTAYSHSQDNTQAHSDYLLNNSDDETSGVLTAGGFATTGDVDIGGTGSQKIYAISTDTDEAVGLQGMFYTHNITTGTVAQTVVANNYQALATVAAGADNNGVLRAMQMTAIASAMDGEHQGVYGFNLRCGMQNTSDGLLKNAEGIAVDMWSRAGTITNLKGIAIKNPFTGGTVTTGYGIWDETSWNWALDGDDKKILFGEAQDSSIYYNGTNMVLDGQEVGTGGVVVNDLTASKPVFTDASKKLVSQDINTTDIVYTCIVPTTQTVNTGTLSSGTVSDVQTWQDGNEVAIAEVTGVPGFDVEYTIPNVADFNAVQVGFYYVGSSTHDCVVEIYDVTNTTWKELYSQAGAGLSHNLRYAVLPIDASDFIDGSDNVKVRFYHPAAGNASHDLYIDYVCVVGKST